MIVTNAMTGNVKGLAKKTLEYTFERQKADFSEEKGIMTNDPLGNL